MAKIFCTPMGEMGLELYVNPIHITHLYASGHAVEFCLLGLQDSFRIDCDSPEHAQETLREIVGYIEETLK
jgi:hypothetical protein